MTFLITGASGFIGSYLCYYFLKTGHKIIATARDVNKIPDISNPDFFKIPLDVLDVGSFTLKGLPKADVVIHTATSNDIISKNAADGILLSAVGTKNVLDLCIKGDIPKIIFFSTFQVYGSDLEGLINEETITKSQSDYGLNHVFGEQYVEMYAREKGLTGIVVRPSNVYGSFTTRFIDRWTLVPGCFCKEIAETGKIVIRSSGLQTRNFVHLENIGRALVTIARSHNAGFGIYNIASSENYSMREVAEMVKRIYESKYHKPGIIVIQGSAPILGNSFKASLDKLMKAGFSEDKRFNLESTIDEIFIYIEKQ